MATLRRHLGEHRLRSGRRSGLVSGRTGELPFDDSSADTSLMIATGVNAKALTTYLGHASVTTYDRYGHLMPENESEATALLETCLERSRASVARQSLPASGGSERT